MFINTIKLIQYQLKIIVNKIILVVLMRIYQIIKILKNKLSNLTIWKNLIIIRNKLINLKIRQIKNNKIYLKL